MTDQIKNFNEFLNNDLNKQQYEAATQETGSLLVVAGAGSGKTRIITARIANLILNHNVEPYSIVALTFTNKAAGEMKERLHKFLGTERKIPFVGTFHSYCLLLLRTYRTHLKHPEFSILDGNDQLSLIKQIINQKNLQKFSTPNQIIYQISQLKNRLYREPQSIDSFVHPQIKQIYLAYETEKQNAHCYDFDDLILSVLDLFKTNKEFKASFQRKINHILVDEYQDTSITQHDLLKQMAIDPDGNFCLDSLCAVGDEDQSIYSWRGANVMNMLKLKSDFAPVTTIKVEQNYRSVKPILDAANEVIENNLIRNPKKLWSDKKATNRILALQCRSGEQEATAIATLIKNLEGNKKGKVAILYRTHYQSRPLEEELIYHSIPYKIVGGLRFYERKEIKDILAYLRLVANPYDKVSLMRIINYPLRGLGQKFEDELLQAWQENPFLDFKQLIQHLCSEEKGLVTGKKKFTLELFLHIFADFKANDLPTKVVDHILKKTDYLNYLRGSLDAKEADTKIENVQEFVQSITNFEHNFTGNKQDLSPDDPFYQDATKPSLENFLYEVSLLQEKIDENNGEEHVQMMTLHAAKGLEFDTIAIVGLEEELLPSARSLDNNESLEEERRLFYVGMTRAREYLLLSHASYRNKFGMIVDQVPSRFLKEISKKLVQSLDIQEMHPAQLSTHLQQWQGIKTSNTSMQTFGSFVPSRKTTMPLHQATPNRHGVFQEKNRLSRVTNRAQERTIGATGAQGGGWQKNQRVGHKTFGIGIVTLVEKADSGNYYITAIFKTGKKKILSSFLQKAQ